MKWYSPIQLLALALTETAHSVSVQHIATLAGETEERVVKALQSTPEFTFVHGFDVDAKGMVQRGANTGFNRTAEIKQVFEYWRAKTGRAESTKMTPDRTAKIRSRLKEGYTVSDLCKAVDGIMTSDFHTGANDNGKPYTDCSIVFRNAQKVDHFMSLAPSAPVATPVKREGAINSHFEEPL